VSSPSNQFHALASELQEMSLRARQLSAMAQAVLGGSTTGVDRVLVESLTLLARSTHSAADTLSSLPRDS
jgi:hypothetical protein